MKLVRYPDLVAKGIVNSRMTLKRLIDWKGSRPASLLRRTRGPGTKAKSTRGSPIGQRRANARRGRPFPSLARGSRREECEYLKRRGPHAVGTAATLGNSRTRASGEYFRLPQSAPLLKLRGLSLNLWRSATLLRASSLVSRGVADERCHRDRSRRSWRNRIARRNRRAP